MQGVAAGVGGGRGGSLGERREQLGRVGGVPVRLRRERWPLVDGRDGERRGLRHAAVLPAGERLAGLAGLEDDGGTVTPLDGCQGGERQQGGRRRVIAVQAVLNGDLGQ